MALLWYPVLMTAALTVEVQLTAAKPISHPTCEIHRGGVGEASIWPMRMVWAGLSVIVFIRGFLFIDEIELSVRSDERLCWINLMPVKQVFQE